MVVAESENIVEGIGRSTIIVPDARANKEWIFTYITCFGVVVIEATGFIEPKAIIGIISGTTYTLPVIKGNDIVFDNAGAKIDAIGEILDDGIIDDGTTGIDTIGAVTRDDIVDNYTDKKETPREPLAKIWLPRSSSPPPEIPSARL